MLYIITCKKKDYYNMVGTNKYTETARDKYIYENSTQSMNKKKRNFKLLIVIHVLRHLMVYFLLGKIGLME